MIQPTGVIASLRTARFAKLLNFYEQILGKPETLVPQKWARFQLPGCALVLWHQTEMTAIDGSMQLCLIVENLDQTCHYLSPSHSVSAITEASHGREAFLQDPDGNTLILYQPLKSNT